MVPMQDSQPKQDSDPGESRWELMRDVLKFQVKLVIDGLRDLLMSPISLLAAVAGLLLEPKHPGRYFQRILDFGRGTEEWINLFDRIAPASDDSGIDEMFGHLEARLIEQCQRGGLTANAKRAVDGSLDRLHRVVTSVRRTGDADGSEGQTAEDVDS